MKKKYDVSIIILNYNDYKTTIELLELIKDYNDLSHIIVVDNNSNDGSYDILKKFKSKKIDVIKNTKNGGYSQGNNYGAFYAITKYKSEYIIISNPDVIISDDIIGKMITEFEKDANLGIASPKLSLPPYISYYNYNFIECICSMFLLLTRIKRVITKRQYGITNFFPGSFFMIDASLFEKIDGFDEHTFLYCEEIILNKKIREYGKYPKIFENFSYIHNQSITVKKVYKSPMEPYKIYINSLKYYLYKYLKINFIQKLIFNICYWISYVERCLYDIIKKIMFNFKRG